MVDEKSWDEFRESGLFWFVNTILHTFGWALVLEFNDDKITRVYPARVKFRGFTEKLNTNGYRKITKYLKENIDDLEKETNE